MVSRAKTSTTSEPAMVNLALQGGGAHGAFTWGVLDRLLQDGRIGIEAVSGTSAGAVNSVVMVDGYMRGGRDGAREALHHFWKHIANMGAASPIQRSPIDIWLGNYSLDHNPAYVYFDAFTRMVSPYESNPVNLNPLKTLLEQEVDFERVRCCTDIKLFISATNVHTGRVKVFTGKEISAASVMASSCLPLLFQAVEIDGVPYWDGGFMGNPVLFPFFYHCQSRDILLVQINPLERKETPTTAREIKNRMDEITFNAALTKELRAIEFVGRLIEAENLSEDRYKRVFMHIIDASDELAPLSASSKFNAEWRFFKHLHDIGQRTADAWLSDNFQHVGTRSTFDLSGHFQTTRIEGEV
ncbi:MAG: patatin-like phospholipase family protein [Hyphomicrobiales bacterium]|nr:patatin-like phospholipase family protein [Hyphomicrobiales bacterium]